MTPPGGRAPQNGGGLPGGCALRGECANLRLTKTDTCQPYPRRRLPSKAKQPVRHALTPVWRFSGPARCLAFRAASLPGSPPERTSKSKAGNHHDACKGAVNWLSVEKLKVFNRCRFARARVRAIFSNRKPKTVDYACFNCGKLGHFAADCPQITGLTSENPHQRREPDQPNEEYVAVKAEMGLPHREETIALLSVQCPWCHAGTRQRCFNPATREPKRDMHEARYAAAGLPAPGRPANADLARAIVDESRARYPLQP